MPPQSQEAERATLACCLQSREALTAITESLKGADDFYAPKHQTIYTLILHLRERGLPVDRATVTTRAEETGQLEACDGAEYIARLAELQVQVGNVDAYAEVVADKARRRLTQDNLRKLADELYDPDADMETIGVMAAWAVEDTANEYADLRILGDVAAERVATMRKRLKGQILGQTYGFNTLDKATGGMEAGKLILLAARPSMGKTGLALDIAKRSAQRTNLPSLFVARDDSAEALADRAVVSGAQVSGAAYRLAALNSGEWDRVAAEAERLQRVPVFVTSACRNVPDIRRRTRWLQKRYRQVGMVVVDYLQLLRPEGRSNKRYEQVQEVSQSLKTMAVDLGVPVIAISQLSRAVEQRPEKRPVLSDLYESGQLEADAEVVMFLYREEYYLLREGKRPEEIPESVRGKVEVLLAKQKNMPVCKVTMHFRPEWVRFDEIEQRQDG